MMAETDRRVNLTGPARTRRVELVFALLAAVCGTAGAEESPRRTANERFFVQSTIGPGLLVPLYVYPSQPARNEHWNRLIELKRSFPRVPVCAIINAASGPGERVDPNYVVGIRRLNSAGIVMLGYVSTSYAKIDPPTIRRDIDRWRTMYPLINGIFLDEMTSQPGEGCIDHYVSLTRYAHESGFWPVFANPGTLIHEDYFTRKAADVFVIHELAQMPGNDVLSKLEETTCSRLGILVYGQPSFDPAAARRLAGTANWLYITEGTLEPHPWDRLSRHCEAMLEILNR